MGLENPLHILILLVVVLLVFGAKRLPEIGRSLGEGMRGFKDSLSGEDSHRSLSSAQAPETDLTGAGGLGQEAPAPVAFGAAASTPAERGEAA
jgi:sec-independent protein translocase protein TatA